MQAIINNRRETFAEFPTRDLEYALNRLADGESIDSRKLKKTPLRKVLIPLREAEEAIIQVLKQVEEAKDYRGYTFVVGDYGTGKTQLRELLIETTSEDHVITMKSDLGLTSFGSFALDLAQAIREGVAAKRVEILPKLEPLLQRVEKASDDAEIYRNIVEIFQKIAENNLVVFLNLDEVDMIPSFEAFTPWANFIVMVNQHLEAGLQIVFYMAPRDIQRLWDKDTRLTRFSRYISKAFSPGTTFGDRLKEAVGQLTALYEAVEGQELTTGSLQLLAGYIDQFEDTLRHQSLRKVNTGTYQIVEFLSNLQKKKYWQQYEFQFREPSEQQAGPLENAVNQILKEIHLEFEFADAIYHARYDSSTTSYVLTRELDDKTLNVTQVPCVFTYALSDTHNSKIRELKALLEDQSCLLLMVGPPFSAVEKDMFTSEFLESYDTGLEIISVSFKLAPPLLLYTHPEYTNDFALRRQLVYWFDLVGEVRSTLLTYFEDIVRELYEYELEDQLQGLREQLGIEDGDASDVATVLPEDQPISANTSRKTLGDQRPVSGGLTPVEVEVLLRILAIYGSRIAKKKENLVTEVIEDLSKSGVKKVTEEMVESLVRRLISKDHLKETPTQYRRTSEWDPKVIFTDFNLK